MNKDPLWKEETHIEYNNYQHFPSTLMKQSKLVYCNKYFEANQNNIENTWKRIRSLFSQNL